MLAKWLFVANDKRKGYRRSGNPTKEHQKLKGDNVKIFREWNMQCTLQDEFIIPCPKFGTNEISGLNDL